MNLIDTKLGFGGFYLNRTGKILGNLICSQTSDKICLVRKYIQAKQMEILYDKSAYYNR